LRYFLSAVRDTAKDAIQQSRSILDLRDRYRSQFASRHRALVLIDALFVNPFTSISRAAGRLGVSHPTASAAIQELANAGMLTEVSGRSCGRRWLAVPILRAIEGKPPDATVATDAPNA
jgi:Fic family protein